MEIRPFCGWRYCTKDDEDLSRHIAPPYDILSAADKQKLLGRCQSNIVAVDLPHVPPKGVGPDEAYQSAADLLGSWKSSGLLRRDPRPAVYAYEQTYRWAGKSYTRRAVICGVRGTKLGQDVIPHEQTFPGPKADRLKLTEYTRMQLSPIFGFHSDPRGEVAGLLAGACSTRPDAQGRLREVTEKLWVIDDVDLVRAISNALADVPVFIADGHHRYTTALNYRDKLLANGQIDKDHEANFVMFALVTRDDPGLLVLPTHRIVRGLREGFSVHKLARAAGEFTWRRRSVDEVDLSDTDTFLRRYGPGAIALMDASPAEIWIATLARREAMLDVAPDEPEAWRNLDVAILHKLIIDKALNPWRTDELFIDYTPEAQAVLAACNSGRAQLGICLQATALEDVETIARAGGVMPHKSTYFYPKLATGMVLKPLE